MASPELSEVSGPPGPPWLIIVIQFIVLVAILRVAHWLIPLPGQWDLIVLIGVGVPVAAVLHRFNKARYGAAARAPMWARKS